MESGPTPSGTRNLRRSSRARSHGLWAVLCGVAVLALGIGRSQRLRRGPPASAPWVDPARARSLRVPEWADPRWVERLREVLARQPPFAVGDLERLASLRDALAGLSFVERVERCGASAEAGLSLALVLRVPVACIRCADGFALVSAEGVILDGRWPSPPRLGRTFLPVIGPSSDLLLARARAGDWLAEPEHRDALAVALSMWAHLDEGQRASLGRVVIDAWTARRTSVAEPGVRLELEGARLALFGRSPADGEPGELPAAAKWRSLARALELYQRDPAGLDWDLVDLRWDRPDLALRSAPELAALSESAAHSPGRSTRLRERDDSRPWVR